MARKRSDNINIPLDLTLEILKKLPTKSLARFHCVSYRWASIIKQFIIVNGSIVTRCLTQPPRDPHFIFHRMTQCLTDRRILRGFSSLETCSIFSYTYLHRQITNEEQLYDEKIFGNGKVRGAKFQYVRGLIGFWFQGSNQFKIHNPTTRKSIFLPIERLPLSCSFLFGYDPFKNQYKVLCVPLYQGQESCKVFILEDSLNMWWDIKCEDIGHHSPCEQAVCINGVIYYTARSTKYWNYVLVSFNVSSDKFSLVKTPENLPVDDIDTTLVNYQGKLGCICRINDEDVDMWVMENAEKQEWSKITFHYMLQDLPTWDIRFAGVTNPGGEIVIVHKQYLSEFTLDVYYYDPEQKIRRRVEIQTPTFLLRVRPSDILTIWAVTDHVENIMRLPKVSVP